MWRIWGQSFLTFFCTVIPLESDEIHENFSTEKSHINTLTISHKMLKVLQMPRRTNQRTKVNNSWCSVCKQLHIARLKILGSWKNGIMVTISILEAGRSIKLSCIKWQKKSEENGDGNFMGIPSILLQVENWY